MDGTSQKKDDLNDFLIFGNPVIERLSLVLWHIFLVPVLDMLGRFKDVGSSSVNGALDLLESWLEGAGVTFEMDVNFEERLQDLLWHVSSSTNSLLHLVKRVLGGVEKSLIHGPVVVLGELLDLFSGNWLDMLVKLVRANGLNEILDSALDLVVLRLELLGLLSDPFRLHLNELIKGESLGILRKVDQNSLRETLEVVLNSVLHDVVDVNDQLLELGETVMHMGQISIDVHGSPGESNHTWSELVLKIFKMRHQKGLGVRSNLVDDSVVLLQDELQLVVVHLELVLLEKDNLGALWNVNSDSGQALGFSDEGQNFGIEVDIQLVVLWVTDYESGLKTSLCFLDLVGPFLSPEVLEREESVTNLVVHLNVSLKVGLLLVDQVLRELLHWS